MMSKDQENAVKLVYNNFYGHDMKRGWTEMDDLLDHLDFLTDEQTVMESEIQLFKHSEGQLKCSEDHGQSQCLVPDLMDAVNGIIELYQENEVLHPKNRYILHNYLAVSFKKVIYLED